MRKKVQKRPNHFSLHRTEDTKPNFHHPIMEFSKDFIKLLFQKKKKFINLLKYKKDKTKPSHKCVHAVNVRIFDAQNDCGLWISIKFSGMGRLNPWNVDHLITLILRGPNRAQLSYKWNEATTTKTFV